MENKSLRFDENNESNIKGVIKSEKSENNEY